MKLAFILSLVGAIELMSTNAADLSVSSAHGHRDKRALCDLHTLTLLGFGFNDSLCASKCLVIGLEGGWCERGECYCRVEKPEILGTSSCAKCLIRKSGNVKTCKKECRHILRAIHNKKHRHPVSK